MTKEEIIEIAKQSGAMFDHMTWVERDLFPVFERFAKLVAEKEREECADLLMGLHEAQSNNDNHNYYHFASNAIKELRGKTITIKTKQYKPQRTWVGLTELDCVGWFGYDTGVGAWFETNKGDDDSIPLYKEPPQREWVGLTDEEIQECLQGLPTQTIDVYARRIEIKIKEKNT